CRGRSVRAKRDAGSGSEASRSPADSGRGARSDRGAACRGERSSPRRNPGSTREACGYGRRTRSPEGRRTRRGPSRRRARGCWRCGSGSTRGRSARPGSGPPSGAPGKSPEERSCDSLRRRGPPAPGAIAQRIERFLDPPAEVVEFEARIGPAEQLGQPRFRQPAEEFGEALDQVALGEQQIDGELYAELADELVELTAQAPRV